MRRLLFQTGRASHGFYGDHHSRFAKQPRADEVCFALQLACSVPHPSRILRRVGYHEPRDNSSRKRNEDPYDGSLSVLIGFEIASAPSAKIADLEHFSRRCIVWMAKLRAHAMARPYSDDLRRKLLEAFDQGKGSLSELAEDFGVSLGWAWKVSAARKRTGRMERPSYRPGAKRRIDEQALAGILRSQPDATLVELQAELESKTGLRVSTQHLWRVVKRLGFRLKKSHSTPKNVTRKRTASGAKSSSR
jgi:transposase